jgi:MFS family permease
MLGTTHFSAKLPEIALNSPKYTSRTALWSKKRAPTSWSTRQVSTTSFCKKLARVWSTNDTLKYLSTPVQTSQKKHNGRSTFHGSDGSFVRSSRATSNTAITRVAAPGGHLHTLFTQTVAFAADEFGVSTTGQGVAAAIVRLGIVLAIPLAILGDRIGRQRVVIALAFIAPVLASLGALAPNFAALVGTQTIARPVGLALDVAVLVILIEEMPKHGRAYGLSVLALASGFGAGFAVAALPIADLGPTAWRFVYVLALIWLAVALSLRRRLTETPRFVAHRSEPKGSRRDTSRKAGHTAPRTLLMVGAVAFLVNIFVATASIFQNRYLKDVRDYSATMVALFTLSTSTPAALGLIIGGKIADINGRRRVAALCIPLGAVLISLSFVLSSVGMWVVAIAGGIVGAIAYPALAVYRGELFPTGNRATSSFLITVSALLGGSIGLVAGGMLVDSGWSYGTVMLSFAAISLVVSVLILAFYPETANKDLEDLNPQDAHARFER